MFDEDQVNFGEALPFLNGGGFLLHTDIGRTFTFQSKKFRTILVADKPEIIAPYKVQTGKGGNWQINIGDLNLEFSKTEPSWSRSGQFCIITSFNQILIGEEV